MKQDIKGLIIAAAILLVLGYGTYSTVTFARKSDVDARDGSLQQLEREEEDR